MRTILVLSSLGTIITSVFTYKLYVLRIVMELDFDGIRLVNYLLLVTLVLLVLFGTILIVSINKQIKTTANKKLKEH